MRVLYFGTYRAEYSRNRIMMDGLRLNGVEVFECHEPLWHSVEDRVQAASGGWRKPGFWLRVVRAYARLVIRFFKIREFDLLVLGYPGQYDVFPARLLAWLRRKPLVWDIFMSTYLIALERGLDQRSPFTIQLMRRLERLAVRLPDRLILDTEQYVQWFEKTHGIRRERFRLVPTGADERIFQPAAESQEPNENFTVLYYGTFIPNHSVPTIVEAARILQDDPRIRFQLIGTGPDLPLAQDLAKKYCLQNIRFSPWLEQNDLVEHARRADICLGAFGVTPQSIMTVQNKIYEGLALGRPVITGDSAAVRSALEHRQTIYVCQRADPASLAHAIQDLQADPGLRARLAQQGRALFLERFTIQQLGKRYRSWLAEVAGKPEPSGQEGLL